jgi:3-hydroxyacyl-CoA dehydrogenase
MAELVDTGNLGQKTGKGFYHCPPKQETSGKSNSNPLITLPISTNKYLNKFLT